MYFHSDEIFRVRLETKFTHFPCILWRDSLHFHPDQFIDAKVRSDAAHFANVLRRDALHAHADERFYRGLHPQIVDLLDVGRRHALNLHGDQFVGGEVLESRCLHRVEIGLFVCRLALFFVLILVFVGLFG